MDGDEPVTVFYCDCWDSLCDIGEHYPDDRCYTSHDAASRRCERLCHDVDGIQYRASVRCMRLHGVKSIEFY